MKRGALLIFLCACSGGILNPPTGPGTPYPCGLQAHQCAGGGCCGDSEVCGGQPGSGCPADSCCYGGEFGTSKITPQRKP